MPSTHDITDIITRIEQRLREAEHKGIHLKVAGQKLEDDWLYVTVVPSQPGVRASDHANLMAQIERELREQGAEQVLLVPAMED